RSLAENTLAWMGDPRMLAETRARIDHEEAYGAAMQRAAADEAAAGRAAAQAASEGRDGGASDDEIPPLPEMRSPVPAAVVANANRGGDFVAGYNQAVALANKGDYKGAIALLETLFKQVQDDDSRNQIVNLVEKLRNDAARLHKPVR